MPNDQTITAVANGGSPQPVKAQEPAPTSKDDIKKAAEQIVEGDEVSVEELESPEDAAIAAAEKSGDLTKKQAQDLRKKLKIKVDGEESEVELDFNDEETLKKHLQKSNAFDKRLKEFSSYKNQVDQMIQMLQNDPEAFLEKAGYNVDDMAEKRLKRKVEEMKKTPEQLEKETMQKELEGLKKKLKDEEDLKAQAEMEKLRQTQAASIQEEIMGALDDVKNKLPKNNPFVVEKIARNMVFAMKNGYPNVTAKDVIPIVEKQWKEELRSYFDTSTEDFFEELVGKSNLDRYRKQKISAARKSSANTQTAKQIVQDTGNTKKVEKEKPKASFKKLFSYHDE